MNRYLFSNKNIGIWGFGTVGQSALRFFARQNAHLTIHDARLPNDAQQALLQTYNAQYEPNQDAFLAAHGLILPSPGIHLRPYAGSKHIWLSEADLFDACWSKPIIAVTGSVGKTSVVHLLAQILECAGKSVAVGGNIGTGMLDLLACQNTADYALLELSSFQLALCRSFAPDLAIITNLYPNHLDRHDSFEAYVAAKLNIVRHQRSEQQALVPPHPSPNAQLPLGNNATLTFGQNWQLIGAALELLNIPFPDLQKVQLKLPEHRLEHVATIGEIDWYNDSKATTPQAVLAAIKQLKERPIILLLGGLSKGVSREPLIAQLIGKVKQVIAFGAEAAEIKRLCQTYDLTCATTDTLEQAVKLARSSVIVGDQILFSPGGSSFDLFCNYQKRGQKFKELVHTPF